MTMNDRVLLIGGTQGTGLLIARLLLVNGYRVRALARNETDAKQKLGTGVEIVAGDITKPETLPAAAKDMDHIIFTAGVTKRPAGERVVRATEYDGVRNTLDAAAHAAFGGRFLYMTSIGVTKRSLAAIFLNLIKGNTLRWRRRAEDAIRRSGLAYTIIRAGILTDAPAGARAIELSQREYPLAFKYRIARADVAEVFVQALKHPGTSRTTLEAVWGEGAVREEWDVLFGRIKPDV
jgi:uncharacterized protein YbjT (DUF2867 family)